MSTLRLWVLWLGFLGLWGSLASRGPTQSGAASTQVPQVYVVTLQGRLGPTELARCHRALRSAESLGVASVVFRCELDTGSQTENAKDLQTLFDHVQASPVATVTLIRGRATQGAAYLALVTDRAYCLPGAQFGEITKPEPGWDVLLGSEPELEINRRFDAARDALRARLQQRKLPLRPDALKMAEAMVDPRQQLVQATVREAGLERNRVLELGELAALQGSGAVVLTQERLTRPLMVDARTAEEVGLTQGTVQDLDQLCTEVLGAGRGAYAEVVDTWSENMVGWLDMIQPFLLVAGFLLILLEIKTPGFALPGALGVLFLALALFHSYLVGLADVAEIVVFFLGLVAIGVEIFVLPGTLIFGGVGFLCLVLALVLSQQSFAWPSNALEEEILVANLLRLLLQCVAVMGLAAVLWRVLPKVPWLNSVLLPQPAPAGPLPQGSGLGMRDERATAFVGRTGTAVTVLRPTGAIEIDGERLDVVTEGEFLESGTPVRVLYVQGSRVVVAAVEDNPAQGAADRSGQSGNAGVALLLAVVGLALIVTEVFLVSFGVISILAGVALVGAVFLAFQVGTGFGFAMLVGEAVAAPLVVAMSIKLLPRTRLGRDLILAPPERGGDGPTNEPGQSEGQLAALLHQHGTTLSPLRPAGFARINGRKVDVVTRGEMLDANQAIQVIEVAGNRVVVARR